MLRPLLCASALLLPACWSIDLPEDTAVSCAADGECPAEQKCAPETHVCARADATAPGPIDDLRVDSETQPPDDSSVTLVWTAPGDDGHRVHTRALGYTLRITHDDDETETALPQAPREAGSRESFRVRDLAPAAAYTFVILAHDEFDNALPSNEAEGRTAGDIACEPSGAAHDASTCPTPLVCSNESATCVADDTIAPGAIRDVRSDALGVEADDADVAVQWTAVADDGAEAGTGRVASYRVHITPVREEDAPLDDVVISGDAVSAPGLPQRVVLTGVASTVYAVSVTAVDDTGNTTGSNTARVATGGPPPACANDGECQDAFVCRAAVCTLDEDVAPGPVSDLRFVLAGTRADALTIEFTAPGDDAFASGTRAQRYRVELTHDDVDGEAVIEQRDVAQAPQAAFAREQVVIGALVPATRYDVALIAVDDAGNESKSTAITAETGGGACIESEDGETIEGDVVLTSDAQLTRVVGCTRIAGSLTLDFGTCEIEALALLDTIEALAGNLVIRSGILCANSDELTLLGRLTKIEDLTLDQDTSVKVLTLPALKTARDVRVVAAPRLVELTLPALDQVDALTVVQPARSLEVRVPALRLATTVGLDAPDHPVRLDASGLTSVETFDAGGRIVSLELGALADTGIVSVHDTTLTSLALPALLHADRLVVSEARALTTLDLGALRTAGSGARCELNAPAPTLSLTSVGIATLSLPALQAVDFLSVSGATSLTSAAIPADADIGILTVGGTANDASVSATLGAALCTCGGSGCEAQFGENTQTCPADCGP